MTKHLDLIKTFAKGNEQESPKKASNHKAVIYTRVSSKEQMDNLSLETQLKGCNEFAKRFDYDICGYFGGTYESAMSDERKEFIRMINFVKKSKAKIAYIVVYSLERFSRTGDNAIWLSRQLRELGVTIVSVTQPIDTSNPSGVLQQNILFLFSQYDNDLRRQKCVAGMKEKLLRGEWMGILPLGYTFDRTHNTREQKVIFSNDAPLIRKAFMMKLQGFNHQEISDAISAMGLKLTVKRLTVTLRNPFYCGYIAHNMLEGQLIKGKHEPLISEEIFLQVNDLLKKIPQGYRHSDQSESMPLKRLIKCGDCHAPLTGYERRKKLKNGKVLTFYYYKCYTRGCKCNKNVKIMHDKFTNFIKRFQLDHKLVPLMKQQLEITYNNLTGSVNDERKAMNIKLTQLHSTLDEIDLRYASGKITDALYAKTSTGIRSEIKRISDQLEEMGGNISNLYQLINEWTDFASKLGNLWVLGSPEEKKKVQELVFPEGIYFDKKLDGFRTPRVNEVVAEIARVSTAYKEKKGRQEDDNLNLSPSVAGTRLELVTFGL